MGEKDAKIAIWGYCALMDATRQEQSGLHNHHLWEYSYSWAPPVCCHVILFLVLARTLSQGDLLGSPALFCLCISLLSLLGTWVPLKDEKYSAPCSAATSLFNALPQGKGNETLGWTQLFFFTLLFFHRENHKMACPVMSGNPRQITTAEMGHRISAIK